MFVEYEVVGGAVEFFVWELWGLLGVDFVDGVSDGLPVLVGDITGDATITALLVYLEFDARLHIG